VRKNNKTNKRIPIETEKTALFLRNSDLKFESKRKINKLYLETIYKFIFSIT
jgi:hypothetical protein